MRKALFIGFLTFQLFKGYSQYFELGAESGYVTSSIAPNGYKISFISSFFPIHTIFFVNSGLTFQHEDHWNFIKLPMGITFSPGNKVKFLAGTGLVLSYASIRQQYFSENDIQSITDFQLGLFFIVGCNFQLTDFLNLFIKPQYELGLTPLYKSPRKDNSYLAIKTNLFSVNVGLSVKIPNKKTEANKPAPESRPADVRTTK
ncbi:hypothetical protein ACFLS7_05855 [Bacteroidota bacterium]